jgi:hypothetical protein
MGEYSEYRESGSGDTISMDQFYGAFAGYIVTQGTEGFGIVNGFDETTGMGSLTPTDFKGINITQIFMMDAAAFTLSLSFTGTSHAKDIFTTFTGGGFTLQSAAATYKPTNSGMTTWTWTVSDGGGWTGSGDLEITIR